MLPTTILLGLSALTSLFVVAKPEFQRHAGSIDARGVGLPSRHQHGRHAQSYRREQNKLEKKKLKKRSGNKKKRCVAKTSTSASSGPTASRTQSANPAASTTPSTGSGSSSGPGKGINGLIKVETNACGANGATTTTTKTTGPNGSVQWIDCGIDQDGGWNPANVTLDDMVYLSLDDALAMDNNPFGPCQDNGLIDIFKKYAASSGVPEIMIASFAMQESSCNPQETGGGGEVGLFQLSSDKCVGVDDCTDPDTNTQLAVNYIQGQLESTNGNVFVMVAEYNGWSLGMTQAQATAAADGPCCRCQNNLDYIFQWANGWMLAIDAYSEGLGYYFNLNQCPNDGALGRRAETEPWLMRHNLNRGWRF